MIRMEIKIKLFYEQLYCLLFGIYIYFFFAYFCRQYRYTEMTAKLSSFFFGIFYHIINHGDNMLIDSANNVK